MKISALFLVAALVLPGAAALAQQPSSLPDLGLREIADKDLDRHVAKSNGVVGLLNASLRGKESWARYLSWVDVKRGPTGKERIIYGLYSVGASARDAIARARKSAADEPAIPALDGATRQLADTFDALIPILNEADAYYDRKDYLSDDMAGGKALHARLVPAATAFLEARAAADALQDQFKDLIDRQQLSRIEATEGKSVRWHARNTLMLAKKTVDLMPSNPRRGADLKPFDAALAAYGEAVRDFDTAVRESGKSTSIDSYPRDILGKLREMRVCNGSRCPATTEKDESAVSQNASTPYPVRLSG
ncbi:YiiG family protein [Bradyrhizobium sp. 2TAF24]|uniref:YiiG family protein n=1 Tax=Bradyrhizobium sp. 2TAF24 TaxID=3233011 RepID=UPI003F8E5E4E